MNIKEILSRDDVPDDVKRELGRFFIKDPNKLGLNIDKENLKLILDEMPVMINAFDDQFNIILWNKECERVTGYSAEEMIKNSNALKLLYPDEEYRNRMIGEWNRRGNKYRHWEWEITCKDTKKRNIAWSNISGLHSIPGWRTWGIGVDITQFKQYQTAIEELEKEKETAQKYLDIVGVMIVALDRN